MFWDPPREMFPFDIPLLGRPILWYGFFFALGFFWGYFVLVSLIKKFPNLTKHAREIADKVIFYVIIGTIVGARVGDIAFYQGWRRLLVDPLLLVKVWEGGLASHGGAAGIIVAVALLARRFKPKFPQLTFLTLLDLIVIPTGLVAASIRVGNFFNQEILGKPTDLPWAVTFGHPIDGSWPVPRHPVQLYEAAFYLVTFSVTYLLWKKVPKMRQRGKMVGLFLIIVFVFRFLIEFVKEEQSDLLARSSTLTMGQWLSIPFVLLGFYLLLCHRRKK